MKTFIVTVVLMILFVIGLLTVMRLSWAWHLNAHPVQDVTLILEDGKVLHGEYSKTWNGKDVLRTGQGSTIVENTLSLSYDSSKQPRVSLWRFKFPVVIFLIGVSLWCVLEARKIFHHNPRVS
jgi:hypothetical protein